MIVLPGLINMHQHHWYNLFKGLAGGMLLEPWVQNLLLPCIRHLTAADLRAAAYLSAMEMIRTGTTCCLNHSVTTTMAAEVEATIEPMAEMGFEASTTGMAPSLSAKDCASGKSITRFAVPHQPF
jgi:5-methylthioadenosine/S-adenosylhomocysteine deaminase